MLVNNFRANPWGRLGKLVILGNQPRLMDEKPTYTASVKYNPSPENYAFLIEQQAKKNKTGPSVGLDRIVDQLITEVRNNRIAGKEIY